VEARPPDASLPQGAGAARRLGSALAASPHLCAIRDGVVAALPVILVSSALLLLASPPLPALAKLMAPAAPFFTGAVRALNGGIALYVAFGCAQSLALKRGVDPVGPGIAAAAATLLSAVRSDGVLPLDRLNQSGLFAGLLFGIVAAELAALTERRSLAVRLPEGVPPAIARAFASLLPATALLVIVLCLRALEVDLIGVTQFLARPLVAVAGSFVGVLLVCLCDAGLYYLGVHPAGLLSALQPIWLSMLLENQAAHLAGLPLPHIAPREFFLWFVWQGGSGGTLGLMLCLFFTKAPSLKVVRRLAIVPSLFNINEPLLFGLPIVLNPVLAIPFLLGPLISASVAYLAFSLSLVSRPAYEVLWTLPAPVGALLACADWRAVCLELTTLSLSACLWWPFIRRLDRERLAIERAAPA
jgi:PTS system cellobiose-specific IIC component